MLKIQYNCLLQNSSYGHKHIDTFSFFQSLKLCNKYFTTQIIYYYSMSLKELKEKRRITLSRASQNHLGICLTSLFEVVLKPFVKILVFSSPKSIALLYTQVECGYLTFIYTIMYVMINTSSKLHQKGSRFLDRC